MLHAELSQTEIDRRRKLTENVRNMIIREMVIRDPESDCVLTSHRDFFLQISFSEIHPAGWIPSIPTWYCEPKLLVHPDVKSARCRRVPDNFVSLR